MTSTQQVYYEKKRWKTNAKKNVHTHINSHTDTFNVLYVCSLYKQKRKYETCIEGMMRKQNWLNTSIVCLNRL